MSQIINPPTVNYMPQQGQDFMQSYLEGLKFGQDLQAFKKQQAFKTDYTNLLQQPSGKGMLDLMVKYPEYSATLKPIQEAYSTEANKGKVSTLMQLHNALLNNKPELALSLLETTKTAFKNAGEDTSNLDTIANVIKTDVKTAEGAVGLSLASLLGPEKYDNYEKAITTRTKRPGEVQKLESEIAHLQSQTNYENAKTMGENVKTQGAITGQKNSQLAGGLLDASTALAQGDTQSAMATLEREEEYARKLGMPTYNYALAMQYLNANDAVGAKRVLDTAGVEVYGKDWKDIVSGQTALVEQPSKVLESKSKATTAQVEANYAPQMAKIGLEIKELDKENQKLLIKKTKVQTAEAQAGIDLKIIEKQKAKIELIGKQNELGGKMNDVAGSAKTSYDTINRVSTLSDNLFKKLKIEEGKPLPATGTIMGRFPTVSDVSKEIINDIDNVKNETTLLQAKIHKGELTPMSDTDVNILANATNSLSEHNSPAENKRQLKVINTILKQYGKTVQKTTGYDEFQAEKYKPYIPQSVTGGNKVKKDPLGLFNKGK